MSFIPTELGDALTSILSRRERGLATHPLNPNAIVLSRLAALGRVGPRSAGHRIGVPGRNSAEDFAG